MGHTPGPWRLVIDDSGDEMTGWPLCITASDNEDKMVVRTGGQWPYKWDDYTSKAEAVDNARLIAAAPDLLEALEDCVSLLTGELAGAVQHSGVVREAKATIAAAKQGEE